MAGCVIIQRSREKRAESPKTAFARACALQPSHRVQPNRARIIRGRAFDPRLWVRPIACAFVGRVCGRAKAAAEKKPRVRVCRPRLRSCKSRSRKKSSFAGLCRACSPSKRPGLSIHPQQRKTAGKQPSRVMVHSCGRGHHLRPASLAALASACARVGLWPFSPLI